MKGIIIGIAATAIAFAILINVLPASMVSFSGDNVQLVVLAILFGLVNSFIKPVVKILSFPISMMTLGLFGLVVNAAMLLLVAYVGGQHRRHQVHGRRLPGGRGHGRHDRGRGRRVGGAGDHLHDRGARRPRLTSRPRLMP